MQYRLSTRQTRCYRGKGEGAAVLEEKGRAEEETTTTGDQALMTGNREVGKEVKRPPVTSRKICLSIHSSEENKVRINGGVFDGPMGLFRILATTHLSHSKFIFPLSFPLH